VRVSFPPISADSNRMFHIYIFQYPIPEESRTILWSSASTSREVPRPQIYCYDLFTCWSILREEPAEAWMPGLWSL